MTSNTDIFGQALWDYHTNCYTEDIVVHSSIAEDDEMPIPYLFRNYQEMPLIEQEALRLARGATLDIGSCAGSHSLWLQNQGIKVTAIDISEGAVMLSRKRGLNNVLHRHILHLSGSYDTILLLMNGTGIFETIKKIDIYLQHLKSLLNRNGQILIDGSDIKYMFENEDETIWKDDNKPYYGEVEMAMSYKGYTSSPFNWLYLDFDMLSFYAKKNELQCELILEGNHYDYLARLTSVG